MKKSNGFFCSAVLVGALLFIAGGAVTASAGSADPIIEPDLRGSCDLYVDTVYVSVSSIAVGDEAAIPIRVGSDEPFNGFSIYLQLPDFVVDPGQVRVENGTCPWDVQDWHLDTETHQLLINYTGGGDFHEFHANGNFLWLFIDTHCWQITQYQENITLLRGPDILPTSYFAHSDCTQDPINVYNYGYLWFHNWVQWRIAEESAMIGDNATLTVSCANTVEFSSFAHAIEFDTELLEFVDVIETTITEGELNFTPGVGRIDISADDPAGFGEDNTHRAFYNVVFKVLTHTDGQSITVNFAAEPREMVALDCGQLLHEIPSSISYSSGAVNVIPLRAEFNIGDAVWTNFAADPGEVRVPLWLKNNYEVTSFNLAMSYAGDVTDGHLEFTDFEGVDGWDLTGMNQYCGNGDPYWYAKLETIWDQHIPPSEDFRIRDGADTPDPNTEYTLQFIENGCGTYPTWVELDDASGFDTTYVVPAPQVVFHPGTITIEPPLVSVNVPGISGTCDKWGENCEYQKSTSFNVKSNVDLDSVTFRMTWSPDYFCVNEHDLQGDVSVWYTGDTEVTITIRDIAASPDWVWFGCLQFINAMYFEVSGDMEIAELVVYEAYPVGTITTQGTAGSIYLKALPLSLVSCAALDEAEVYRKPTSVPTEFALLQNHPNPFNASTVIEFAVPEPGHATLEIYNIMGQRMAMLKDEFLAAGQYSVIWDGRDEYGSVVASGMYFYRLRAGRFLETRKMVLMK